MPEIPINRHLRHSAQTNENHTIISIGDHAFLGCSGLENIKVDAGNKEYDSRENCNAIIETNSNTLIAGCKNTIIPDGVTSIRGDAFRECVSLTSIKIPEGVTRIGSYAFLGCSGLESIKVDGGNKEYDSRENCNAIIETNSNTLIVGCKNTIIPKGVTRIGDAAFCGCNGLTSIKIPEGVTRIGSSAFSGCSGLTSIIIPEGVARIGSFAFSGCSQDLVIYGKSGSEAERYAKANGIKFQVESGDTTEPPKQTDISQASITLSKTSYTYDGTAKVPSVTVKLNGKVLIQNTDYTVSYKNNINPGTAKVIVTGKGSYTGSKSAGFTIKAEITCKKTLYQVVYGTKSFKINAASKSKLTFASSNPKTASVDKNTGKVTIKNTGIAVITVKAGKTSVKVTVKVSPKKQSLKSVKISKGKKLTVTWTKDKKATGYQVQVSTDKKFKKNIKQKNVTKATYTFTKLKTGEKYYVRVRSYKKSGKESLYGAWSSKKQAAR